VITVRSGLYWMELEPIDKSFGCAAESGQTVAWDGSTADNGGLV